MAVNHNKHIDVISSIRDAEAVEGAVNDLHWISAAAAVELIRPFYRSVVRAQHAICEHADAQLVRARARRFIMGKITRDDSVVPSVFWWAKGHIALKQDWQAGAFSTWINDVEHRAYGVTFAREDIESMMPSDIDIVNREEQPKASNKVFLVHGRDEGAKNEVELFLKTIGLDPIILHKRANGGRHLLTKFTEESEGASFAVVLMTPDDEGSVVGSAPLRLRARQNVVFELGYFIGKLGPSNVAALLKGDVEKPSDFDGIAYIAFDAHWKMTLARELDHADIPFDLKKAFSA